MAARAPPTFRYRTRDQISFYGCGPAGKHASTLDVHLPRLNMHTTWGLHTPPPLLQRRSDGEPQLKHAVGSAASSQANPTKIQAPTPAPRTVLAWPKVHKRPGCASAEDQRGIPRWGILGNSRRPHRERY